MNLSFGETNLELLQELIINNTAIEVLPHNMFTSMKNLLTANLSENVLNTTPKSLGNLPKLKELNLSHNRIEKLPPHFGNFPSLVHLNLSHNHLSELPPALAHAPLLKEANISHKKFTAIPAWITDWKAMTSLDLGNNRITIIPGEDNPAPYHPHHPISPPLNSLNLENNLIQPPKMVRKLWKYPLSSFNLQGNPVWDAFPYKFEAFDNIAIWELRALQRAYTILADIKTALTENKIPEGWDGDDNFYNYDLPGRNSVETLLNELKHFEFLPQALGICEQVGTEAAKSLALQIIARLPKFPHGEWDLL